MDLVFFVALAIGGTAFVIYTVAHRFLKPPSSKIT